jgi:hypothetical protein
MEGLTGSETSFLNVIEIVHYGTPGAPAPGHVGHVASVEIGTAGKGITVCDESEAWNQREGDMTSKEY